MTIDPFMRMDSTLFRERRVSEKFEKSHNNRTSFRSRLYFVTDSKCDEPQKL